MDGPQAKPFFELGTILNGQYRVGHWLKCNYYLVVGHSKRTGAPKVRELQKEIVSQSSTPADSTLSHRLHPSKAIVQSSPIYTARWSKKENAWQITIGDHKDKARLKPYVDGQENFREDEYY